MNKGNLNLQFQIFMDNKIVAAKKKAKKNNTKKKGYIYSMGQGLGNRVAGKVIMPDGEKNKIPYNL